MTLALLAPSAGDLALAEQFLAQGVDFFPSSEEIDASNPDIHAPGEENHESTGELLVIGQNLLSPRDQFAAFIELRCIRYADFSALSMSKSGVRQGDGDEREERDPRARPYWEGGLLARPWGWTHHHTGAMAPSRPVLERAQVYAVIRAIPWAG